MSELSSKLPPELSIAVVAKGRCDPEHFWQALVAGGFDDPRIDVHLAYDDESALKGMADWVTGHRRVGASVFGLLGMAMARCRSSYVALFQIHAPPAPGWVPAMLSAIRTGAPIYWGPVEEGYGLRDPRLTGYLVEYAQFHRPIAAGMEEVPGNNIVLRRSLAGPEWKLETEGFAKSAHLKAWHSQGQAIAQVDEAVVLHMRPFTLRSFCLRRFRHGHAFAAGRAASMSVLQRIATAATMALLPALRVGRILGHARRIPKLRHAARIHLGALIVAETMWSAGELCGYLRGSAGDPDLLD